MAQRCVDSTFSTVIQAQEIAGNFKRSDIDLELLEAAERGYVQRLQALLAAGANVDFEQGLGTALYKAAENGQSACVAILLQAGSDPNKLDCLHRSPLHAAIAESADDSHFGTVEMLLATPGIRVEAHPSGIPGPPEGFSPPLSFAANRGNALIVSGILDNTTDKFWFQPEGITQIKEACQSLLKRENYVLGDRNASIYDDAFKKLLQFIMMPTDYQELLPQATNYGRAECVKALVANGADINCFSEEILEAPMNRNITTYRVAPLGIASAGGNASMVKMLLELGAERNQKCELDDFSALHNAVESDSVSCISVLLEAGCDVDIESGSIKWSPLCLAAVRGHINSAKALVQGGANIHKQSHDGQTPLDRAREIAIEYPEREGIDAVIEYLEGLESSVK